MEFWIKGNTLYTWLNPERRIQESVVANGVIDGDWNNRTGEWLIVRENGRVESLTKSIFLDKTFSNSGVKARWSGDGVQVTESDGRTRIYCSRGFLQRVL